MRRRNWLLFLLLVSIYGANWSAMKVGVSLVPPLAFVSQRFIVSALSLLPVLFLLRKRIPRDRGTLSKLTVLGLLNASQIVATNVGLTGESSGIGSVLTYTYPLFVFALAIPLLREKITSVKLLGVAAGFIGIVVLFSNKMSAVALGSTIIMLVGAFLYAAVTVYYKKFLSQADPFIANVFQYIIGAVLFSAISAFTNGFIVPSEPQYLWAILYSSIVVLSIGGVIWLMLLREEKATVLTASSFIVPVIALLFGWQLLGESVQLVSLIGAALTLGGVCLVNRNNSVSSDEVTRKKEEGDQQGSSIENRS